MGSFFDRLDTGEFHVAGHKGGGRAGAAAGGDDAVDDEDDDDEADEKDEEEPAWAEGDVVWAKVKNYPWWPAVICADPKTGSVQNVKTQKIHTSYYGDNR